MFKINDKVKIVFRDETVYGIVSEIKESQFLVKDLDEKEEIGWFPLDVGNYVTNLS